MCHVHDHMLASASYNMGVVKFGANDIEIVYNFALVGARSHAVLATAKLMLSGHNVSQAKTSCVESS